MSQPKRRLALSASMLLAVAASVAVMTPASPATPTRTTFTQSNGPVVSLRTGGTSMQLSAFLPGTGSSGNASPYPIEMEMASGGVIKDMRFVVNSGLSHANPDDLDLLLVGPHGQQALVMSDAGGQTDMTGAENFIIAENAAVPLPDEGAITNGSYLPANYGADPDIFPAPAPALTGNSSLDVFTGTDVQGTWKLFVVDDKESDVGNLDGVILDFTMTSSPYPSTLDVSGVPGTVTDLDVVLDDISGPRASYLDLLLVGPQGQQAVLASDAGNANNIPGGTVLTLDDEAATVLPQNQPLVSGRFQPANYADGIFGSETDSYPAPAPPATAASELSAFDGTDPNGTWRLFGVGDTMGTNIPIGSWSLDIEYADSAAPAGSVSIAGGATATATGTVPVTLSAADPSPGTGVAKVRFSNDGGSTWSAFSPFSTQQTWTLAPGDGTRTVTAQFADGAGNLSVPVSDSIVLDTTAPAVITRKPGNHANDVKAATRVKVFFTETLDPATWNAATLTLKAKGSSKKVKATVVFKPAKSLLLLRPRRDLKADTVYKVTLATGPKDLVGNPFDGKPAAGLQPLKWTFRTR